MPTYTVRDPKTGRTVKLTGDGPPTAQELEQVFASLGGHQATSEAPSFRQRVSDAYAAAAQTRAGAAQAQMDLGRRYLQAGPGEVVGGAQDIASGEIAKGGRRLIAGTGTTVLPAAAVAAPLALAAAPIATAAAMAGGLVGGAAATGLGQAAARSLGASDDQAGLAGDVAGIVGGGAAGRLGGRLARATGELVTERLPERAYAQIFKDSGDAFVKRVEATEAGRAVPPTLAKKAIDAGYQGSSEDMARFSLRNLGTLENELQAKAQRHILVMPDKKKYVGLLDEIERKFGAGFFSDRADEAGQLKQRLMAMEGPNARATDVLAVRRFLDRLRQTSTFRLDPNLTQKQEELKVAADRLRAKLHSKADLSTLIEQESTHIQALDAIVDDAAKRGNRSLFGLMDAVMSSGGPQGVALAAGQKVAQTPQVMTGAARGLYRGGRAVQASTPISRPRAVTAGAVTAAAAEED